MDGKLRERGVELLAELFVVPHEDSAARLAARLAGFFEHGSICVFAGLALEGLILPVATQ